MKNTLKTLVVATLLASLTQLTVHADTQAITGPSAGGVRDNYSNEVGFTFSLDNNETLTSLGVLDLASPPMGTSVSGTAPGAPITGTYMEEVGIYSDPTPLTTGDSDGTLLASAEINVPGTAADFNQFDFSSSLTYNSGTSLTLTASTDYVIVAEIDKTGFRDNTPLSAATGVNVIGNVYSNTLVFGAPDYTASAGVNAGDGYLEPNFTFSTPVVIMIPEPSTYALLGLGILVVGIVSRRATRKV